MSYPSLEQYNEALQHPQLALVDPELKKGTIAKNGLGLPLALCGGFALTYTVSTPKKYAVRCFHKQSNALEGRYRAISSTLRALRSSYFLDFDFQPQGVRIAGNSFPVVKMDWASGTTLGEFLEDRYRHKADLASLRASLLSLSSFLEAQGIAHGDIQPGNLMVSNGGRSLQLIDYDGMFVSDLRSFGSAELGHRNFQHPGRTTASWDVRLDRFSFIALALALRALESNPGLWADTASDSDGVLFRANDFARPDQSSVLQKLLALPDLSADAKSFAAICSASFTAVPTLGDFLERRNIPQATIRVSSPTTATPVSVPPYISTYPVLEATNYAACLRHVGDRVELIGRIVELKQDKTRYGKPYVFINFGHLKGNIVKITIWSEGLRALTARPDVSWVGRWVSVVGLLEPPYRNARYGYSHLSITVTPSNQIHQLPEAEARFRLGARTAPPSANQDVLRGIHGKAPAAPPTSANQAILQSMRGTQTQPSPVAVSTGSPPQASPATDGIATRIWRQVKRLLG